MEKFTETIIRLAIFATIFIVMQIAAGFIMASITFTDDTSLHMFVTYALSMLLTFLGLKVYTRCITPSPEPIMRTVGGFNPILTLVGVVYIVALSIAMSPLEEFMPVDNSIYDDSVWTLILVVIVAPILEEVLFRGKLYNLLRISASPFASVLLSSLLFGVVHFEPMILISGLPLGLLFGFVYLRTRSIIAPIILHMCNNALAYALVILSYNEQPILELVNSEKHYTIIYIISLLVVMVCLIRFITYIIRYGKHKQNPKNEIEPA